MGTALAVSMKEAGRQKGFRFFTLCLERDLRCIKYWRRESERRQASRTTSQGRREDFIL